MKWLAGSTGAVAVIAFGIFSGAGAESLGREPTEYVSTSGVHHAGSSSMNALEDSIWRRLQASGGRRPPPPPVVNDDALDPTGTVSADNGYLFGVFL